MENNTFSLRKLVRDMAPGDTCTITLKMSTISALRGYCSLAGVEFGGQYSVHMDRLGGMITDEGLKFPVTITRSA